MAYSATVGNQLRCSLNLQFVTRSALLVKAIQALTLEYLQRESVIEKRSSD